LGVIAIKIHRTKGLGVFYRYRFPFFPQEGQKRRRDFQVSMLYTRTFQEQHIIVRSGENGYGVALCREVDRREKKTDCCFAYKPSQFLTPTDPATKRVCAIIVRNERETAGVVFPVFAVSCCALRCVSSAVSHRNKR